MSIERYVLVNRDNVEDDYEYDSFDAAKDDGAKYDKAVIERTYVYEDSDLAWTPDGGMTWPPKPEQEEKEDDGE